MIRQETSKDYGAVYRLIKEAFATAEHDLVAALRKGDAWIPELSIVAEIDGTIIGHILFSKAKVGGDDALVLAPVSVLPAFQNQGVGSALMNEGHRLAKKTGVSLFSGFGKRNLLSALWVSPGRTVWD